MRWVVPIPLIIPLSSMPYRHGARAWQRHSSSARERDVDHLTISITLDTSSYYVPQLHEEAADAMDALLAVQ